MIDKLIQLLNSLKSLSWQKLAELTVLIVILVCGLALYENRTKIYDAVGASALANDYIITVNEKMQDEMKEIVTRSSAVLGLHVAEVNFVKNTRHSVFFVSDDPPLKTAYDNYMKAKVSDAPALGSKEFENNRLVRLVNGEFVCLPFENTIASALFAKDAGTNVGQVCSLALPPIYGKFRGYVTAYVSKDAKEPELGQIKLLLQSISIGIYSGK